jgi:mercuric ion transport protein
MNAGSATPYCDRSRTTVAYSARMGRCHVRPSRKLRFPVNPAAVAFQRPTTLKTSRNVAEPLKSPALASRVADSAGAFGAIFAALCCAGTAIVVSVVTALGIGFLRQDAILWPLMLLSLLVAVWGFWQGLQFHRNFGPLLFGSIGAVSLALGVIVVHGFPAMQMIYGGALILIAATVWNVFLRRACIHRVRIAR